MFYDDKQYVDLEGRLHRTAQETIEANQAVEGSFSRGSSGGCTQDAKEVPQEKPAPKPSK